MTYLRFALFGVLLFMTACSTETSAPAPVKTSVTLELKENATFGMHLTTSANSSLYLFSNDSKGAESSACNDACAATWPAFTFDAEASELVTGQGLDQSKLGSFKRADGKTQITYNGWPLYTFSKDAAPGDTNGQGVGGVWFLVNSEGKKLESTIELSDALPCPIPKRANSSIVPCTK